MRRVIVGATIVFALAAIGCGSAAVTGGPPALPSKDPEAPDARRSFADGLAAMALHDRARDWSDVSCKATSDLFLRGGDRAAARYDAAIALERCGRREEAAALHRAAIALDPAFAPARVALAMDAARKGGRALDEAIADLEQLVRATRFADAGALVALAALQMRRDGGAADAEGANDFDRARRNLHRALAIDDGSMPALNQLALHHLAQAKRAAEGARKAGRAEAGHRGLELAALVCAQAARRSPRYAPIHNTAGLVFVELGDFSRAAAEFDEARRLDPTSFEAHLNYADVNLAFRGFARAEEGYRAAIALLPGDYDARLGLALALRGQIGAIVEPAAFAAVQKEIEAAKKIAPDRPEAYFNHAILLEEFGARSGLDPVAALSGVETELRAFLARAGERADLLPKRKEAVGRLRDIDEMRRFAGR